MGPDVRWRLWDTAKPKKAVILVSKEGHCLHDLLGRVAQNDYPMDVAAVIGNHEDLRPIAQAHGIPFHYVPFPKDAVGKRKAFDQVADLVNAESPDAIVLARFMQILPPEFLAVVYGRAPLSPGLSTRRETHRRHLPLRHRRPRRRPDHRTGRHSHFPQRYPLRYATTRSRRRENRPRPRPTIPPRRPCSGLRKPNRHFRLNSHRLSTPRHPLAASIFAVSIVKGRRG